MNILLNILASSIEQIGEEGAQELLQKFATDKPAEYAAAIVLGNQFITAIKPYADSSKWGGIVVDEFDKAIVQSAAANGINLT